MGDALQVKGTTNVPWNDVKVDGAVAQSVHYGRDESGVGEVQVAVATIKGKPTKALMSELWKIRGVKSAMPVVVAAVAPEGVYIYSGGTDALPLGPLPHAQAALRLQAVLDEPDGLAAANRLRAVEDSYQTIGLGGFANHYLFASYHLKRDVPRRDDWEAAGERAQPMLARRGAELIAALGFDSEKSTGGALVLRGTTGQRRAIAVLLDESENFDQKSARHQLSPVAHGLELARREEVAWVVLLRQSTLRLYPGRDGVGVGQRGQSETYFELDLAMVDPDFAALLPLIFSAEALEPGGSADEILAGSGRYAADLGSRLRDRVYLGVVPRLSIAVAERLPQLGVTVDAEGLQVAYKLSMRILFRLLFQAYGEATELLPAGRNEHYDANSLRAFVERELTTDPADFAAEASSIWRDLVQVWDAIAHGNPRWEVPAYGGSLFDPTTDEGRLLERLQLPDSMLGPALQAMLTEQTEDGVPGAVDFRSLQVREFGTIYEGLLESSLSLAETDLTTDKNGVYIPAPEGVEPEVQAGEPYFHSASGERKATGSYYTPKIVVDHLIERSVEPALDAHLARVKALMDEGHEREAGDLFFDFRVADLAMGSAHFLVAAVDKIERGMRDFLTATPVPSVIAELGRLEEKAKAALGADTQAAEALKKSQLLRRQVARRCVYGLDINPLAVELSRLALWIHTFVPGLPMSSLDHGLVLANSLTGMASIEEALGALDPRRVPGASGFFDSVLIDELQAAKEHLIDFGKASEADKAEVEAGARLLRAAESASMTAKAVLDAAVAVRDGSVQVQARFTREDLDELMAEPGIASSATRLLPGHFPYLFPEVFLRPDPGFNVIVGNPPWDKVRWEAAPYWAKVNPGLMALRDSVRDARVEELRLSHPTEAARERQEMVDRERLQALFKQSFEWRGGTHLELAQLMLERALKAMRPEGRLALVLPRQCLVLAGWKKLRAESLFNHDVELVQARNVAGWMFENLDPRYAVVLMMLGEPTGEPIRVSVAVSSDAFANLDSESMVRFSPEEIQSSSDSLVVPWFAVPKDRNVFEKLRMADRLASDDGWIKATHDARWDFRGTGPDRSLAARADSPGAWRVMMTRHVDAYSIRSAEVKQFLPDWSGLAAKNRGIQLDPSGGAEFAASHPVVIFRHPSRSDDTRTLIATALPSDGYLFNKGYVHALAHASGTGQAELLAVLGVLSSNTTDWWARRFVDRHVTAPVINNLPMPNFSRRDIGEVADRVACLLVRNGYSLLAGGIDVSARAATSGLADDSTDSLLAGIEALVARGHGLTSEDLAVIKADFSSQGMTSAVYEESVLRLDEMWEIEQ